MNTLPIKNLKIQKPEKIEAEEAKFFYFGLIYRFKNITQMI